MSRLVSEQAKAVFWARLDDGWPAARAARAVGIGVSTGVRWARAAGRNRPVARPLKDPAASQWLVELLKSGVGSSQAASITGVSRWLAWDMARRLNEAGQTGLVIIDTGAPPGYRLGWADREAIAMGVSAGRSLRSIAADIGRPVSTVSREIARNKTPGGGYRIVAAQEAAQRRAARPKAAKLAQQGPLRDWVADNLNGDEHLSPEQIANRLRLEFPDDPEMRVCHETIYQAVYVQARGGLKRETEKTLRRGGTYRKPQRKESERRGRIPGMVPIAERPGDIEDRLVPGNWEGDLIVGAHSASAVATLVERGSRVTMLGHLPGDHTAATVRDAIVPLIVSLPEVMRKTLTWDQGSEMACHFDVAEQADIDVYFADPHSPWQRGTNENTNGLLREYLPKGTDLSIHSANDLQNIADALNNRPRKVLGWLTPLEAWHLMLGHEVTIGGKPAHLPDTLAPLAQRCVDH